MRHFTDKRFVKQTYHETDISIYKKHTVYETITFYLSTNSRNTLLECVLFLLKRSVYAKNKNFVFKIKISN